LKKIFSSSPNIKEKKSQNIFPPVQELFFFRNNKKISEDEYKIIEKNHFLKLRDLVNKELNDKNFENFLSTLEKIKSEDIVIEEKGIKFKNRHPYRILF
jgi:hypothetical protein